MSAQPYLGWPGYRQSFTAAEAIVAAQPGAAVLVERRAGTDLVGNAAAGSLVVAGAALDDVPATRASVTGRQVGDGHECTVYRGGAVNVVTSGAVTEGQKLIAGANGTVVAAGAAPDARTIVGEALAAASSGASVKAYIY